MVKKNKCNICGKVSKFSSLEDWLDRTLVEKGFPYPLSAFETLNYKRYGCSYCQASDRDRLYRLYFDKFLTKRKLKLIDFAPSTGLQEYLKSRKNILYRSADLYMQDVDDKVDITDMKKYKNGQFDFFICSHILEHVDDKKTLNELYRILRKGGKGILMTPIIDDDSVFDEDINLKNIDERWRRFAQDDHIRLYSKSEFLKRVKDANFGIKQLTWRDFGIVSFLRYGISVKSVLYIVERE